MTKCSEARNPSVFYELDIVKNPSYRWQDCPYRSEQFVKVSPHRSYLTILECKIEPLSRVFFRGASRGFRAMQKLVVPFKSPCG